MNSHKGFVVGKRQKATICSTHVAKAVTTTIALVNQGASTKMNGKI